MSKKEKTPGWLLPEAEEVEHHVVDRTGWSAGPWDQEADKYQWVDPATNLDCLIVRNRLGGLCGYVGVSEAHPCFEQPCDEVCVSAHGGLTYSNRCHGPICHVPEPGRPDNVWWLGFDCGHAYDLLPGMIALDRKMGFSSVLSEGGTYRDLAFVRAEIADLARQLSNIK